MSSTAVRALTLLLVAIVVATISACTTADDQAADDGLVILTTTGMIHDAVVNVAGAHATATALMGPGVDPHLYKATQGDLGRMMKADIVFYNGLHLEGKMGEVFEKLARTKPVIAVAEGIPESDLRSPPEFKGSHDPHIWFDVRRWSKAVRHVADELKKFDTAHASEYERNAVAYIARLDSLDAWVREQIATIPAERRVLITAHDAFGYFGDAYGIEVRGLQGISTVSEYGLADVSSLVDLIVSRRIKAVFVESSVPKRSIEAVVAAARSRGHDVTIGGQLYSDAMGDAGTPEGTYIGMVSANVNTITRALR